MKRENQRRCVSLSGDFTAAPRQTINMVPRRPRGNNQGPGRRYIRPMVKEHGNFMIAYRGKAEIGLLDLLYT